MGERGKSLNTADLDEISNIGRVTELISQKPVLNRFYEDCYKKYSDCLNRCPEDGLILELGSGGGFAKKTIPNLITSDVLGYPNVDKVVDATQLCFEDNSLRAIFLLNVFHHIPDVEAFLREAQRCLKPGGRVLIIDQHLGWISKYILKYFHHEPFDPGAENWSFKTSGPLSGANGALTWMVFKRDQERFNTLFPSLSLVRYQPHTPLLYWVSGGLKNWSLAPKFLIPFWIALEKLLVRLSSEFGSFTDVEIAKTRTN